MYKIIEYAGPHPIAEYPEEQLMGNAIAIAGEIYYNNYMFYNIPIFAGNPDYLVLIYEATGDIKKLADNEIVCCYYKNDAWTGIEAVNIIRRVIEGA